MSYRMVINFSDVRDMAGRYARFPAALFENLQEEMNAHMGQQLVEIARGLAPYNNDPFRTQNQHVRESFSYQVKGDSTGAQLLLYNSAPQMVFLIEGTRPHVITGDPLAFYWDREGVFFKGPEVHHPGMEPIGFIEDFNNAAERLLLPELELSLRATITEVLLSR